MPRKRTAALFDRICLESVKPLFHQIYMPRKHTVAYFARACQEGVHLLTFDRVRMLKPP